jgi:hypothetical protein
MDMNETSRENNDTVAVMCWLGRKVILHGVLAAEPLGFGFSIEMQARMMVHLTYSWHNS